MFVEGFHKTANTAAYEAFEEWAMKNHRTEWAKLSRMPSTKEAAAAWDKLYQKWRKLPDAKSLRAEQRFRW